MPKISILAQFSLHTLQTNLCVKWCKIRFSGSRDIHILAILINVDKSDKC